METIKLGDLIAKLQKWENAYGGDIDVRFIPFGAAASGSLELTDIYVAQNEMKINLHALNR